MLLFSFFFQMAVKPCAASSQVVFSYIGILANIFMVRETIFNGGAAFLNAVTINLSLWNY